MVEGGGKSDGAFGGGVAGDSGLSEADGEKTTKIGEDDFAEVFGVELWVGGVAAEG